MAQENLLAQPDLYMNELLLQAAFPKDKIGTAKVTDNANEVTGDDLRKFIDEEYVPGRMVMVGVNVDHDQFVELVAKNFADMPVGDPKKDDRVGIPKPQYVGGEIRVPDPSEAS